jgi:endonuclease YncB( thermonuclease family)
MKTIEQLASGMTVGHVGLGFRSGVPGSVRQQVHDGDTINVRAMGNFGIRFLGVDAPEVSFTLPGKKTFTGISSSAWDTFLADPFNAVHGAFSPALDVGLQTHIESLVTSGIGINHSRHADFAQDGLETEVMNDLAALGQNEDTFQFFMAFAHEVMDGYGRFLAYINREQPNANQPSPRPLSYNERLLQQGLVSTYFIWPNVNPFRKQSNVVAAVPEPGSASQLAQAEKSLRDARQSTKNNRQNGIGIFDANDPLILQPFEIRFLARRQPPNRWVIDLSAASDKLIPPQQYFTIANIEDRLFIPEEYVPLFVKKGWKI